MAGIWLPQHLRGQPQGGLGIAPKWRDDIAWLIHGGSGLDLVSRLAAGRASPTSLISGTDPYQWSGRGHGPAGHYLSAYQGAGIASNIFSRWRHNPGHNFSTGDFSVLALASNPAEALSGNFLSNHSGNEQWRLQTNYLANGTSGGAVSSGALSFMTYGGAAFTNVGAAGMLDGKPHAYLFVRRGTVHELWRDGALITTQTGTVRNVTGSKVVGPAMYWHLNGLDTFSGGGVYAGNQRLYMSAAWRRAVDGRVSGDPWSVFQPRRVWVPVSAGGSSWSASQTESASASDNQSAAYEINAAASITASATASEAFAAAATVIAAITASASASDAAAASTTAAVSLLDSASADADASASYSASGSASVSEAATADDVVAASATAVVALLESASADEILAAAAVAVVAMSEAASASDSQSGAFTSAGAVAISESASADDAVSAAALLLRSILEAATADDANSAATTMVRAITETAVAADTITVGAPSIWAVSIDELASAVDTVAAVSALVRLSAPPGVLRVNSSARLARLQSAARRDRTQKRMR